MKKIFNRIKNNKMLLFLGILIVGTFFLLLSRVTYAFLAAEVNSDLKNAIVDVDTLDELRFNIGDPITINATPTTLPEGGTNLEYTTTASASLKANDTNNHAEYPYYFYLNLKNNTFVYSDGSTPEIILSVTKTNADGSVMEVTEINGLNYATYNGIAGFDITTKNGVFLLGNPTITSNSTTDATVENWSVKVTYLNLPTVDQSVNFGKSMVTELSMRKKELLVSHIVNLYTTDGANGLYKHDGVGTYDAYEAGDNSIRYTGANPNNYVCLGSDAADCPEDNLFRIIGVFDGKVKLIKNTEDTTKKWDTTGEHGTNTWSESDMHAYLNGQYLTKLGTAADKIEEVTWKIGGNTSAKVQRALGAKNAYDAEIKDTVSTNSTDGITEDTFKIGLMYVSDYMYAADPTQKNAWSDLWGYNTDITITFNSVITSNWMYYSNEWTITRNSNGTDGVFRLYNEGVVYNGYATNSHMIRPCFYLSPNTTIMKGNGSISEPYWV